MAFNIARSLTWKLSPTSTLWTQWGMLIKLVFVQVLNIFLFCISSNFCYEFEQVRSFTILSKKMRFSRDKFSHDCLNF